ncbi:MAG TPA: DUF6084 family protein [Thermomicrobiales bacterium]|nr:DUF6084 family protein [Thermomicrobiales bacterium]
MPDLRFSVAGAGVLAYAAVPTLRFTLDIANAGGEPVRSIALDAQIRIAAAQRRYTAEEQARLADLFGAADRWGETLGSLLWTHAAVQVPPFTGSTTVDLPVACTYDFEVVGAKYFHGLAEGEVPLEFLFSGTVFYDGERGLQAVRIPWDKEARYRLPVSVWRETMEHYFPGSAWLRLRRDVFDRLYRYKTRQGLPTWEAALEALLWAGGEGDETPWTR